MSLFFTLSGYLITTLAIAEMRRTATFDAVGFARRRASRLLPVAALGIVLGVVATLVVDDPRELPSNGGGRRVVGPRGLQLALAAGVT